MSEDAARSFDAAELAYPDRPDLAAAWDAGVSVGFQRGAAWQAARPVEAADALNVRMAETVSRMHAEAAALRAENERLRSDLRYVSEDVVGYWRTDAKQMRANWEHVLKDIPAIESEARAGLQADLAAALAREGALRAGVEVLLENWHRRAYPVADLRGLLAAPGGES